MRPGSTGRLHPLESGSASAISCAFLQHGEERPGGVPFQRTPAGTGSCAGSKVESSDTRRRRLTPARALAVEGRRSNLQGREDVEGRRSERRGQVPLGRHAPSVKGEVRSPGLESDEHRLVVGRALVFLRSPLRRQVFVVVISQRSRRQDGSGSPKIIDQGRNQEQDQEIGEPVHRRGCPLKEATATNRMLVPAGGARDKLNVCIDGSSEVRPVFASRRTVSSNGEDHSGSSRGASPR